MMKLWIQWKVLEHVRWFRHVCEDLHKELSSK